MIFSSHLYFIFNLIFLKPQALQQNKLKILDQQRSKAGNYETLKDFSPQAPNRILFEPNLPSPSLLPSLPYFEGFLNMKKVIKK